jgi:hypothetical protein
MVGGFMVSPQLIPVVAGLKTKTNRPAEVRKRLDKEKKKEN